MRKFEQRKFNVLAMKCLRDGRRGANGNDQLYDDVRIRTGMVRELKDRVDCWMVG